jgi:hypothetical protein
MVLNGHGVVAASSATVPALSCQPVSQDLALSTVAAAAAAAAATVVFR